MTGFDRLVAEDAGMRQARALFDGFTSAKLGHGSARKMLRALMGALRKSGRSAKALKRVSNGIMNQHPCLQGLSIKHTRQGFTIIMQVLALHTSINSDEPVFVYSRSRLTQTQRNLTPTLESTNIAVSLHALGRVIGRGDFADSSDALHSALDAGDAIIQQTNDAAYLGEWKAWSKFPVPWCGGLLIVELDQYAGGGLIFELRTFIDEGLLKPDQIAMRDHLIADGLEALHSYPDEVELWDLSNG